jgi:hypothetical protein
MSTWPRLIIEHDGLRLRQSQPPNSYLQITRISDNSEVVSHPCVTTESKDEIIRLLLIAVTSAVAAREPADPPRPFTREQVIERLRARIHGLVNHGAEICEAFVNQSEVPVSCGRCGYLAEVHDIRDANRIIARLLRQPPAVVGVAFTDAENELSSAQVERLDWIDRYAERIDIGPGDAKVWARSIREQVRELRADGAPVERPKRKHATHCPCHPDIAMCICDVE